MQLKQTAMDDWQADYVAPAVGTVLTPAAAMELALRVALLGTGAVSPNPLVGAVIVDRDHRFLAAGAHLRCGGPHAEVAALAQVSGPLDGAHMYVTLEPCAHQGRTPSCAMTLAKLPLASVTYAAGDPNPLVNGKGAAILHQAGIRCSHDPAHASAAQRLAEAFHWQHAHGLPFVGLKAAVTLDGSLARRGDERQWITSERARHYGHYLRLRYDAVAIGRRTLELDQPTLDIRHPRFSGRTPWRIVFDTHATALLGQPLSALKLLQTAPERVVWVVAAAALAGPAAAALAELQALGAHVIACDPLHVGELSSAGATRWVLQQLLGLGIQSVLLEGGAGLYGRFLDAGLVQRLHLLQAPLVFGGSDRLAWGEGFASRQRLALKDPEVTPLGVDLLIEGLLERADTAAV